MQIEQPSYSVSELKNSVEICVVADNVLDRAINVSLQSSCMLSVHISPGPELFHVVNIIKIYINSLIIITIF